MITDIRKKTVSLCMIVKNEEETILSCLNSIRHLMDEIIVVDTGSVDQTIKLSLSVGAKVINCPWAGDFSAARNVALNQANSDWILVLDADEILETVDTAEFYRLLAVPVVEGYYLHLKSYLGAGREFIRDRVVRLFRNRLEYRFSGAIHEQVTASILKAGKGNRLAVAPLTINHYGYLKTRLLKKNKSERNMSIINKELENSPCNSFLLYCLGMEHYQREEVQQGLDCLEKALAFMQGSEGYFFDVILHIAIALLKAGRLAELIDFTGKALEMLPGDRDMLSIRGLGYLALGCYEEAIRNLEQLLHNKGNSGILPDFQVLSYLGDAYNLAGYYNRAEKAYLDALRCSPRSLYPLTQILGLLQQGKLRLNCRHIGSFASWKLKLELGNKLIDAKQFSLALVMLTLALYDRVDGGAPGEGLITLSRKISNLLEIEKPLSYRNETIQYAVIAGREINAYALLLGRGYSCDNDYIIAGFRLLAEKFLFLFVTEFCPRWRPEIKLPETLSRQSVKDRIQEDN